MRTCCLFTFAMALAMLAPAVAQEREPSYSLEQLKTMARSMHPSLAAADAAAETSVGMVRQARAYPNPEISFSLGRGRPRDGGDSRWENQVQLAQPVEMPGIRRWRTRLAEARLRGVEIDRVMAETVVDYTVATLVYTLLLEERRTEIARESADISGHLHQLLARRVELGESSPLAVARARTEWFARRRHLLDAEGAAQAARVALRLFCGDRLAGAFQIDEILKKERAADLPVDLVQRLRSRNPLLLRAEIAVEEAHAGIQVAKKERFPVIDIFAGHVLELDREASSVGVGLTIPLWNRNRGAMMAATAGRSAASAESRQLVLELETALARSSASYRRALGALRLHQEGWTAAARQALDVVTFSFENGEASLLEVLDAQRSYLRVSLAEAESWAGLALAGADIERLTAGPLAWEDINENR